MVLIVNTIYTILSFALFLLARLVYRQQIMQSETKGLLKELRAFRHEPLSLWKNKQKLFFFLALLLLLLNLPLWCFYIWGKTDANVLIVILSIIYYYYILKYLFPPEFYDDENDEDSFSEEDNLYKN